MSAGHQHCLMSLWPNVGVGVCGIVGLCVYMYVGFCMVARVCGFMYVCVYEYVGLYMYM